MKDGAIGDRLGNGLRPLLLRLAIGLGSGSGAGVVSLAVIYLLTGFTQRTEDPAYALSAGVACLTGGIVIFLACHSLGGLSWVWHALVALLVGSAVTLSTLSVCWWLQRVVFPYARYPDLSYLLGEVGGCLGPGLGLFTCGLVMALLFFGSRNRPRPFSATDGGTSIDPAPRPRVGFLRFASRLVVALILGAGVGLSGIALTYVVIGRDQLAIACYMGGGLGCLTAGVALLLLCLRTQGLPPLWPLVVVLFLVTGAALSGTGIVTAVSHQGTSRPLRGAAADSGPKVEVFHGRSARTPEAAGRIAP
jgi:hypothetical protein